MSLLSLCGNRIPNGQGSIAGLSCVIRQSASRMRVVWANVFARGGSQKSAGNPLVAQALCRVKRGTGLQPVGRPLFSPVTNRCHIERLRFFNRLLVENPSAQKFALSAFLNALQPACLLRGFLRIGWRNGPVFRFDFFQAHKLLKLPDGDASRNHIEDMVECRYRFVARHRVCGHAQ